MILYLPRFSPWTFSRYAINVISMQAQHVLLHLVNQWLTFLYSSCFHPSRHGSHQGPDLILLRTIELTTLRTFNIDTYSSYLSRIFSVVAPGAIHIARPPSLSHPNSNTCWPGCKGGGVFAWLVINPTKSSPWHSRGAWRYCLGQRVLSCIMYVVNFGLPFSQLQGVEWRWPGRREPDDEHSPAS